ALGPDLLKPNGNVNLLGIADRFNQPWQGVENIRAFDFTKGRATTAFPGTEKWSELPFGIKPNQLSMHFHPPGDITPSVEDFAHSDGLVMIRSGDEIVILNGWRSQFFDAQSKGGRYPLTTMGARQEYLYINPANQTAELRSKQWHDFGVKRGWTATRQ